MKKIKLLRVESGYTQKELGSLLKVSQQTIHQYETSEVEPDIATLKRMSKIFNVSIDVIVENDSLMQNKKEKESENENLFSNFFIKNKKNDIDLSNFILKFTSLPIDIKKCIYDLISKIEDERNLNI